MPLDKRYRYQPSAVPSGITIALLDWLRREFQALSRAIDQVIEEVRVVADAPPPTLNFATIRQTSTASVGSTTSGTYYVPAFSASEQSTGGDITPSSSGGTITVARAGRYRITTNVGISCSDLSSTTNYTFTLRVREGASTVVKSFACATGVRASLMRQSWSALVTLAAGAVLRTEWALSTNGSSVVTQPCEFTVEEVP